MDDARFKHIQSDPKFRRIPKNEKKVKIDKRFQSMFNDSKFKVKYTTDKRGRPVNHSSTEDLKRYYALSSDESDEESGSETNTKKEVEPKKNELKVKKKSDKGLTDDVKHKLKNLNVDYARGECSLFSESSSDDEETEDEDVEEVDDIDHKWGELDAEADVTDEATYRLAVCNMDWDRIRAVDMMVLFNSFLPVGGVIKSVTIYPSEFGKKRMAEEEVKGPIELVEERKEDEDETTEGSKYHMEKLRQYQLNRLKYYYAVVVFDSATTANKVYTECDGMEYESSATKIDMRFIPDDMTFDEEPKEMCDKLPELNKYEPRFFTTTALQQAKVDLTWDETNPERLEITEKLNKGKIDDVSEMDLQNYLAASSDEESEVEDNDEEIAEEGGNAIDKYKALLQDIEEKEAKKKNKDVELEVTWGLGLQQEAEKLVKKKIEEKEEKTPFQQYLDKRKEKRKEKKLKKKNDIKDSDGDEDIPSDVDMNDPYFAEEFNKSEFKTKKGKKNNKPGDDDKDEEDNGELELLLMNEDDDKKHFNMKQIHDSEKKSKGKKRKNKKTETKTDDFEVNVADDRFSALFTSHHYNIDPSDPHFKKSKAMETLISEKLKRRDTEEVNVNKKPKLEKKKDAQLSVLVKSVKRNTQAFKSK